MGDPVSSLHDKIVNKSSINYVVDTDIKGLFDNVDHEWMMKFLKHRIEDKNLLRLISRFLKAGIVEDGIKYDTPKRFRPKIWAVFYFP